MDSIESRQINKKNIAPLISVLIPVYNSKKYLMECIVSVLNQTYHNIEVILVDDGSTDGSGAICDAYAEQDKRIQVIHKENSGVVDARKTGVQSATGMYCAFVDSDDWLNNEYIEKMVKIIVESEPDMICCGFIKTNGISVIEMPLAFRAGHYTESQKNTEIMPYCLAGKNGKTFPINLWAKAYKTELCRKMVSVPESEMTYSEDLCCIVYGLYNSQTLYIIDECLYFYRINPDSVCCSKKGKPWNIPQLVEKSLLNSIDINVCDYRNQLDRRLFMEIYNVVEFQLKREEPYKIIAKDIRAYLSEPYIRNIVCRCRFSNSKKWTIKKYVLKLKLTLPIYINNYRTARKKRV